MPGVLGVEKESAKKTGHSLELSASQAQGVNGNAGKAGSEQKETSQRADQDVKYDMYLAMVNGMGYQLDEANDNVNVVGLRGWFHGAPVENIKDQFNDTIVCLYHEKDESTGEYVKRCTEFVASVDPGQLTKDYSNGKGDANLMDGQYEYYKGTHPSGDSRYEAYNTNSSHVWRDKNHDGVRQEDANEYDETGAFGINIHAAGDASKNVGNWSAGCQVIASHDNTSGASNTAFQAFRDIINSVDANKKFVYTLIEGQTAYDQVAQDNNRLYSEYNAMNERYDEENGAYSAGEVSFKTAATANQNLGYSKDKWKEVQRALGFTGGDVDGSVGPLTTRKIALYQERHGLPITGICDDATYNYMIGAVSETPASTAETAPETQAGSSAESVIAAGVGAAVAMASEIASSAASAASSTESKASKVNISYALGRNKSLGYSRAKWKEIQAGIGLTGKDVDGYVGTTTTRKIAEWQEAQQDLEVDGICGPISYARIQSAGYWDVAQKNGGNALD